MSASALSLPFRPYREHLQNVFGGLRLRKVSVHGGMTCPNLDGTKGLGGCTYCDNRGFSPASAWRKVAVAKQIDQGLRCISEQGSCDGVIAYFQPYSNTYAPRDYLEGIFREALEHPRVVGLAIGTRPDCIDDDIADLLEGLARETHLSVEIGLQSAHDATLERIRRGHTVAEFDRAMERCSHRGFEINVHVILGLPGEGPEHWRATADHLAQHSFDSLKIHPLHIVAGTDMAGQFTNGEFELPSRAQYVGGVVDFLERTPPLVALQRYTGDAPGDMLVAPDWCRDKNGLRRDIISEFAKRKTRQGDKLAPQARLFHRQPSQARLYPFSEAAL